MITLVLINSYANVLGVLKEIQNGKLGHFITSVVMLSDWLICLFGLLGNYWFHFFIRYFVINLNRRPDAHIIFTSEKVDVCPL